MRWLFLALAACGGSAPKPTLHFAGDPEVPATPTADVALTALVGGEIPISGAWSENVTSVLTVKCEPMCPIERRTPVEVVVHPPGPGRLVVIATTVRDDNHEKLSESRIYDVVVPEDIGLICRDLHGHQQECDVPNDRHGTVEVVAYVHGKVMVRLGGVRIDGKVVGGSRYISDVIDASAPGPHTVEISGGGLTKKTVIAVAAPSE